MMHSDDGPGTGETAADVEFARAALFVVAAVFVYEECEWVPEDAWMTTVCGVRLCLDMLKRCHPRVESVQQAKLTGDKSTDGDLRLGAASLPGCGLLLRLPAATEMTADAYARDGLSRLADAVYMLARATLLASGEDDAAPSPTEFAEACVWLAQTLDEASMSLHGLLGQDVYFGGLFDPALGRQRVPDLEYLDAVGAYVERLASSDSPDDERAATIVSLALMELDLLTHALRDCYEVHDEIVSENRETEDPVKTIARLAGYVARASLPTTKAVAAEHMAYLYNRDAVAADSDELAARLFAVAMSCAHHSRVWGGYPRLTKYVAQNLLEVARLRDSQSLRMLAEMLWIDAYFAPFHLYMHDPNSIADALQWHQPQYATDPAVPYEVIPAYGADPDFLYTGRGSERLRSAVPSLTSDSWAAAVLLVQHFKERFRDAQIEPHDSTLPVFDPSAGAGDAARFPMIQQHPVAGLYLLHETLLSGHLDSSNLDAGIVASVAPRWEDNRWLDSVVDLARWIIEEQPKAPPTVVPSFPLLARILVPAGERAAASGTSGNVDWTDVQVLWADPSVEAPPAPFTKSELPAQPHAGGTTAGTPAPVQKPRRSRARPASKHRLTTGIIAAIVVLLISASALVTSGIMGKLPRSGSLPGSTPPAPEVPSLDPELTKILNSDRNVVDQKLLGRWVPQLSAVPVSADQRAVVGDYRYAEKTYGVYLIRSADYNFPQYGAAYVTISARSYDSAEGALRWCGARKLNSHHCLARLITHDLSVQVTEQRQP